MIFPILLLALLSRIILLNQSLWLDEATSVITVKNFSFSQILSKFSPGDFHPPFYYFLLKIWVNVFGSSEISVRSLSIFLSLATVYLVYKIAFLLPLARKHATFPIFSSLFLAINPLHIYYSQETRMYALAAFLASALLYELLTRQRIFILTIIMALSFYTFYPLIFLLISLFFYAYFIQKPFFKKYAISFIISFALFVPWLPTLKIQLDSASTVRDNVPLWWQVLGQTGPKSLALVWVKFNIGRINFLTRKGYLAYIFVVSLVPAFAILRSVFHQKKMNIIWIWLLGPSIIFLLIGLLGAGFSYFRLLFVLPAFIILVAFGIAKLPSSWRTFATFIFVLSQLTSLFIYWSNPRFHRENWRDSVSFIENNSQPGTLSVFVNPGQRDPYFYYWTGKVKPVGPDDWQNENTNEIWLFRYAQPIFDPEDRLPYEITDQNFVKLAERDFGGIVIWHYQKKQK